MSPEVLTIISTVSVGAGAGAGWYLKQLTAGKNGYGVLKKSEHDEICKLKFETIHEKFAYSEEQFRDLKRAIEDTRERLLERMDRFTLNKGG